MFSGDKLSKEGFSKISPYHRYYEDGTELNLINKQLSTELHECNTFREFKEETGYEAKKMIPLLTFYPLIGYTTQKVHCFVATGIRNTGIQKLDKDEFLHVVKINIKDTIKLIQSEQIVDSISVCAILYYIFKKRLQI